MKGNNKKTTSSKLIVFLSLIMTLLIVSVITFPACSNKPATVSVNYKYNGKTPKYVFLFIGDGMAMPQINSAETYLASMNSNTPGQPVKLSFTQFPSQGLTTTHSSNAFITDSAAAATAIACGYKTKSGVIAMDPSAQTKHKSIATYAKEKGMRVGIVSSVSIDHATPACFYAYKNSRKYYYSIAKQMADSGFNYYAGGGPKGDKKSKRKGRESIMSIMKKAGYKIASDKTAFNSINNSDKKVLAYDKYLDSDYALYFEMDRKNDSISLAEFTKKGIEVLKNPKGFFLMVEGGKIDWACHANDAGSSIKDTIAFNNSIKVALEFYRKHPNETLIVVTGDHECGGMTLGFAGTKYKTFFNKIKNQTQSYIEFDKVLKKYRKTHTAKNAKISDLSGAIKKAFGIDVASLNAFHKERLQKAFKVSMNLPKDKKELKKLRKDPRYWNRYGGYDPFSVTLTHILNNLAGIGWTSFSHTAVPVPTFAIGCGHVLFNGYYDNTDIFKKMMKIMKLK